MSDWVADTSEEIERAAHHIRTGIQAWRLLSSGERIERLRGWARAWLRLCDDPDSPELVEMAREAKLHPDTLRWGVEATARAVYDGVPEVFLRSPLAAPRTGVHVHVPSVSGHVWASTLPCSGWFPVVQGLILGCGALIKAPRGVVRAAEIFAKSLEEFDPILGSCVRVVSWRGGDEQDETLVHVCDALIVSGGRDAVARFGHLVWDRIAPIPYVPFGPGLSVSVWPASAALSDERADALALDIAAYDQRGCLSPQALFVEETHPHMDEIPRALSEALSRCAERMPRGEVPAIVAARIAQRRATTEFLGRIYTPRDALVLVESEPFTAANPCFRTIPVHTYRGGSEGLRSMLAGWLPGGRIHSAGVAGAGEEREGYALVFAQRGASRVCAFGHLQRPPLTWYHDGVDLLEALVLRTHVEASL